MICVLNLFYKEKFLLAVKRRCKIDDESFREIVEGMV